MNEEMRGKIQNDHACFSRLWLKIYEDLSYRPGYPDVEPEDVYERYDRKLNELRLEFLKKALLLEGEFSGHL